MKTKYLLTAVLSMLIMLGVADAASAASITVSRNPAPPSAVVNDGAHALNYNYQILFTTTAVKRRTRIIAPNGTPVAGSTVFTSMLGATSPFASSTESYVVPAGLTPGRYLVEVDYYSAEICDNPSCPSPADDANYEAQAQVQFDVAASVGNVRIEKYEDVNGDGVRQATEPGVPSWVFQVTAPRPDFTGTDQYTTTTTADGSVTLTGVPSGTSADYQVSEVIPNPNTQGWTPTTGATQSFTLAASSVDYLAQFGNARPASICGNVFFDNANKDHVLNRDAPKYTPPVTMTLSGADGLGNAVAAGTTTVTQDGHYCFDNLMPGSYAVTETVPSGIADVADKDGANTPGEYNFIQPIVLTSGTSSLDNDFALASPTKLCITKKVSSKRVRQGGSVTWTIRVRDCGAFTARKVVLKDPLLADSTLVTRGGATLVAGELHWNLGDIAKGKSKTVRFRTSFDRSASTGKHTNRANAKGSNTTTVRASASTTVIRVHRAPRKVPVTG